jgi:hypothetical protein
MDKGIRLFPFEEPLLPGVYESESEDRNEKGHFYKGKKAEFLESDGPGINKDNFYIKENENECENIILNAVLNPRVPLGLKTALVGRRLGSGRFFGCQEPRQDEGDHGENDRKDKENAHEKVLVEIGAAGHMKCLL